MSERMSEERLKILRKISSRDVIELLDEIDALKAELREKDERVAAADEVISRQWKRLIDAMADLESEVERLEAKLAKFGL